MRPVVTSCCPCALRWPPHHTGRSLFFIFICSIKGWSWAEIHPLIVTMFSSGLEDQAEEHRWSEDGLGTGKWHKWHKFQSSRWISSREDSVDLGRFEQSRTGDLRKWLLLFGSEKTDTSEVNHDYNCFNYLYMIVTETDSLIVNTVAYLRFQIKPRLSAYKDLTGVKCRWFDWVMACLRCRFYER